MSARLRPTKAHRSQIKALEAAGFTVSFLRYGRGDHMIVEAKLGDRTARVSLAGSPRVAGDHSMLVSQARRILRPAQQEKARG